jgi:hypothetical protein
MNFVSQRYWSACHEIVASKLSQLLQNVAHASNVMTGFTTFLISFFRDSIYQLLLFNLLREKECCVLLQVALVTALKSITHMVSSIAEAEFGAVFFNAKEGKVTHTTLSEMGHPQEATQLKTDSSTAYGIINNTVQQKCSKAKDMILYWVKDRVEQHTFNVDWMPGATNMGDYFTKQHSSEHHKCMRA